MMLRMLVVGLAFLLTPLAAHGQESPVDRARQECDEPRVLRDGEISPMTGSSCFSAAYRFYTGHMVPINLELAAFYYRRSCDFGFGLSCALLADMLRTGEGVTQNYREALSLYTQECTETRGWGCFGLGRMHYDGLGTPQNYQIAAHYFSVVCDMGLVQDGCGNLGRMHALGLGVIQDYVRAHALFNLAAADGDEESRSNRDIVARNMTPQQIAEAQALARRCTETSIAECLQ